MWQAMWETNQTVAVSTCALTDSPSATGIWAWSGYPNTANACDDGMLEIESLGDCAAGLSGSVLSLQADLPPGTTRCAGSIHVLVFCVFVCLSLFV